MSNEVQADLAGLQNALLKTDSVEQFLHELAVLAARTVGEGGDVLRDGARQRGRPASAAACSDSLASEADRVQYQSGDGPALHALRHARPVSVHDTATASGWPRFCRQAASLGIRSCYAVPLIHDGEPVGALVLYARGRGRSARRRPGGRRSSPGMPRERSPCRCGWPRAPTRTTS